MPRRKKLPAIPDYKGAGKSPESLLVQKTNPLMSLSETGLTLAEFKILDAYLARINSHDPDKRFIRLEKGEIERLLGVSQIKAGDLEKRIDNLFQTVTIRDKNLNNGFCKIALFERATCYQDDNGIWQVDLGASPSAMEYIFNPERLGYLRNVIKLTSRYSYVLFLYLEQNRHMHLQWEVALDELRALLRCTADTYKAYYRFNELVLSKCCKELNEKTDCKFTYEPIKRGRTVKAIHFTLETVADQLDGQLSLADIDLAQPVDEDEKASTYSTELLGFLASACEFEFDDAEMRVLLDLILQLFPRSSDGGLERFNYLRRKYNLLLMYSNKKKISNRFGYLKSLIKADIKVLTS